MFRNNYHPAFVMGAFCFAIGISFLCFGGILYSSFFEINLYQSQDTPIYDREEFWILLGFSTTGLTFSGSGLGIMKASKVARNIAVFTSFFCLAGLVLFSSIAAISIDSGRRMIQILALFGFFIFFSSLILSIISILTSNDAREYFGEDKLDTHEGLLDNI